MTGIGMADAERDRVDAAKGMALAERGRTAPVGWSTPHGNRGRPHQRPHKKTSGRALMRIVGGRLARARAAAPQSQAIRPTADRLRETLFNILARIPTATR